MTHPIADAFLTGPIKDFDIQPFGVCSVSITFNGRTIAATWYSSGRHRSLDVDNKGLPVSGSEAREIVNAAQRRAKALAAELIEQVMTPPNVRRIAQ